MFCRRRSARMRPAPSLFRCPLIHEEECLWNVKCRLGPVFSAFFSSLLAKESRAFSVLSSAPHGAGREEASQWEQGVPSSNPVPG